MNCNKCGEREGENFTIHYGKTLRQSSTRDARNNNLIHTKTTYQVGGSTILGFCRRCINRRRLLWLGSCAGVVLVGFGILLLAANETSGGPSALGLLTILVSGIVALVVIFEGRHTFGEHWAFRRSKKGLAKQGWDTLWTNKQYARLQSKQGLLT